jgi:parallel beta-helix repeat protein
LYLILSFPGFVSAARLEVPDNLIAKRTLYLVPQDSAPSGPQEGEVYFNNSDNKFYYYDGAAWQVLSGGGGDKVVATRVVAAFNSYTPSGPSTCLGDGSACDNLKADFTCDGTDDQIKIQEAIDDLGSNPGRVYLLEGTYNISGPVNLDNIAPDDSGKALIGAGAATVLRAAGSVNIINVSAVSGVLISQLKIDGNNNAVNGINFSAVNGSRVQRCWLEEMNSNGLNLSASSNNNLISGNHIRSSAFGIRLNSSSGNTISANDLRSNNTGIILSALANNNILNNNIQLNTASGLYGVYMDASAGNSICGNNIQNSSNSFQGIYALNSSNNNFSGNNLQGHGQNGIYLNGSSNNTISGSTFLTNIQRGILISNASHNNNISANVIDSSTNGNFDGIRVETNSDGNTLFSNLLYDSVAGGSGYPINIANNTCDNNYLASNSITLWSAAGANFTDSGTNTRYTQKEKITIERQLQFSPAGGSTLDVSLSPASYLPLFAATPIILSAVTAIADGRDVGDLLILEGRSDANTITIPNNANTRLGAAARVLGLEDTIKLLWNGSDWLEIAYADN